MLPTLIPLQYKSMQQILPEDAIKIVFRSRFKNANYAQLTVPFEKWTELPF